MFLLSIVSFLFICSQFISMAIAGDCTITYTLGDGDTVDDTCAVSDCDNGYYVLTGADENGGTAFTINGSGSYKRYVKVTGSSSCTGIAAVSGGSAGNFKSETVFSLDGTNDLTLGDGKNYLFTDADGVITGNTSKKVVLKSTATSITLNDAINDNDYCVSSTGEVTGRTEGFCNSDCTLYECKAGICSNTLSITCRNDNGTCNPTNENETKCGKGYYLVSTNALVNSATTGTLYECKDALGNCGAVPTSEIPIGYLANADTDNQPTYPYIQCDGTNCSTLNKSSISASDCSGKKVGDLIFNDKQDAVTSNDEYMLCINSSTAVSIVNHDKYFIGYEASTLNAFTNIMIDEYNFIVEMGETDIIVAAKVTPQVKYRYTNANQKIYDTASDEICLNTNKIVEFTLDSCSNDKTDYYSKGTETNGPKAQA
jgi:hypothetical protein